MILQSFFYSLFQIKLRLLSFSFAQHHKAPKPVGCMSPEVARKLKSMSADPKKREKQPNDGEITARSSSMVEYTPVENINLQVI